MAIEEEESSSNDKRSAFCDEQVTAHFCAVSTFRSTVKILLEMGVFCLAVWSVVVVVAVVDVVVAVVVAAVI